MQFAVESAPDPVLCGSVWAELSEPKALRECVNLSEDCDKQPIHPLVQNLVRQTVVNLDSELNF